MLSGLCSLDGELLMEVCWDAQVHDIDIGSLKDAAIIVIVVRDIKFLRKGLEHSPSFGMQPQRHPP